MSHLPGIYNTFNEKWGQGQTWWIYSDPHFGNKDLEYGIKNRPSDEEHIKMINSCGGRKDTLIILGDVGNIECVRKLRAGYKVLIMGNHDAGRTNYERKIEHWVFNADTTTKSEAIQRIAEQYPNWEITATLEHNLTNAPFEYWYVTADNKLFDEVYEGALIIGEKLILSHEPINGLNWAMNIHGHVHSKLAKTDRYHFNVCSDVIGYKPVNLNQFLKSGPAANIQSIHRITIDKATERKNKKKERKL